MSLTPKAKLIFIFLTCVCSLVRLQVGTLCVNFGAAWKKKRERERERDGKWKAKKWFFFGFCVGTHDPASRGQIQGKPIHVQRPHDRQYRAGLLWLKEEAPSLLRIVCLNM